VQYFYKSFVKHFPDEIVDEKKFRYPGPKPFSKETAVLMMADSVEAASRSLKTYDAEAIDKLVDGIIDSQIAENQFVNADVTFKDITTIKKILKKKLLTIYHVRIEYPK
jgi:cyclic-di-AMP phosphodiesterase PgpH